MNRLKSLKLHSPEKRRRGDMTEAFKWMRKLNKGDINKVFKVRNQNKIHTHGFKLDKFRFRKVLDWQ